MEIELYRVKVFWPSNRNLFAELMDRPEFLRQAVAALPTGRAWRGMRWHIGNVEPIDPAGLYFRIGREAVKKVSVLDRDTGNFEETEFSNAPYTHALLDVNTGVGGIARNSALAPTTVAIARRLAQVLAASAVAKEQGVSISVSAIKDPGQFLEVLASAHSVKSFTFTSQRRNPFDTDALFIKPLEKLVEQADGERGKTVVSGTDLNREPLAAIARSVAATGDEARARLQVQPGSVPVVRTLRGDSASVVVDALDDADQKEAALGDVRAEYRRVRGAISDEPSA